MPEPVRSAREQPQPAAGTWALEAHWQGRAQAGAGSAAVLEMLEQMWPPPNQVVPERISRATRAYVLLPNARRPTLALPLGPRRAAAAVLRQHKVPRSMGERLRLDLAAVAAAVGAARFAPGRVSIMSPQSGAHDLEEHLSTVVGEQVAMGVHLGPPRANRKPVLQLVARSGRSVAFVKVGVNALTTRLIEAERDALGYVASRPLRSIRPPTVIHAGTWRDLAILALTPVPTRSNRSLPPGRLAEAMVELSQIDGAGAEIPFTGSQFARRCRARLDDLGAPAPASLRESMSRLEFAGQGVSVRFGSSHGDWTPWNMAVHDDRIVLWDWERFRHGVPAGFDALHYSLQSAIRREGREPAEAVRALVQDAARLLEPFSVARPVQAVVVGWYLVDIALRYLGDGQAHAGARLGGVEHWLLPQLDVLVSSLAATPSRG